jgi:hypothetical protein
MVYTAAVLLPLFVAVTVHVLSIAVREVLGG